MGWTQEEDPLDEDFVPIDEAEQQATWYQIGYMDSGDIDCETLTARCVRVSKSVLVTDYRLELWKEVSERKRVTH